MIAPSTNAQAKIRRTAARIRGEQAFQSDNKPYHELYERLHAGQKAIFDCPSRFRVVSCGRRWGKTEEGKAEAIFTADRGKIVWWISPSFPMSVDVWRELKATLGGKWEKQEQQRILSSPNGGEIRVRSSDNPDSLRGSGIDLAIIDEAALHKEATWSEAIRPALSDPHREGRALFLSTPKGMNWFWRIYGLGLDPQQKDWTSFNFPTSSSPILREGEVDEARELLPDRLFRQEYLAEFTEDSGGVFRGVAEASTGVVQEPQAGTRYVAGLDWAKEHDFTVLSVWDEAAKTEVMLDRFNKVDWSLQRGRIKSACDKYQIKAIWAEENSIGGPNIEALQKDGMPVHPFTTTAQSKGEIIESLALFVERKEGVLLNDPVATLEMQAYELERLPSGRFRYGAPDGMHDDTVIARALAWYATSHRRRVQFAPNPFFG